MLYIYVLLEKVSIMLTRNVTLAGNKIVDMPICSKFILNWNTTESRFFFPMVKFI